MSSMKSIQDQILARIHGRGRGGIHVPADFLDLGSRAAVDQALARLAKTGRIRRITRGVSDFPKRQPKLGMLSPSLALVAAAIARSTGSQLQISGAQAANRLGLSSQVPVRSVYLTDGPTRTIQVGSRAIDFRHTAPRTLTGAGTAAGLVIQALRHLGRGGGTPDVVAKIRSTLQEDDRKVVAKHVSGAPAWMRPLLLQIADEPTAQVAA